MHPRNGESLDKRTHPRTTTNPRRLNWSLLASVCLGLGVVGAGVVGLLLTQTAAKTSIDQALDVVAQPTDLKTKIESAGSLQNVHTRTLALSVGGIDEASVNSDERPHQAPFAQATSAATTSDVVTAADTVPFAAPTTNGASTNVVTAAGAGTSDVSTPSTAPSTELSEPPPGAPLGFTYCGMVTCNVGFKCCCSACVAFDAECEPSACEAYAGLSVSVPCGMDLCDSGEVCCDARCGACARAGECPEAACD